MNLEELLATRSALIVPSGITARFAGFTRYALVDRGSYEWVDVPVDPRIGELVATHTGMRRQCIASRVIRLVPGDFILARHDTSPTGLEVVIDISPAPCAAEVHYRQHGQVFFRVPCEPGTAALVPRYPSVTSNHTYLSKLATVEVVRWVCLFA
ncbi:MAG: hypothetical protein ABJE66_11830 [Deltaproteobacteria bacterium]